MKKHLFILAAGALALTACTSEDVVDDVASSRNQIQFENVVNKPTRADLTTENLRQFNVFGFYTMPDVPENAHAVFNNVAVTSPGTGVWSYSDAYKRFWVPGAKYYFYAYSCGNDSKLSRDFGTFSLDMETPSIDADNRVLEINEYLCDYSHQHDLIFASNTGMVGKETGNQIVSFEFQHILSKIQAKFTSKFSPEYELVIKNVSVRGISNQGDFNFSTGWENVKRKDANSSPIVYLLKTSTTDGITQNAGSPLKVKNEKVVNEDGEVTDEQASVSTLEAYVIPKIYGDSETDKVNLYFEVDLMYKGDYVIEGKPLTATFKPEWNKGCSYIYNVEISADALNMDAITFTTTEIKGWGTPTNISGPKVD